MRNTFFIVNEITKYFHIGHTIVFKCFELYKIHIDKVVKI